MQSVLLISEIRVIFSIAYCLVFIFCLEYNDVEAMIQSLIPENNPNVNGLLLDKHVALSNMQRFRDRTLEIGRTVDYEYNIGMRVKPAQNETQLCVLMKKCANDLLSSEAFELKALKVGPPLN